MYIFETKTKTYIETCVNTYVAETTCLSQGMCLTHQYVCKLCMCFCVYTPTPSFFLFTNLKTRDPIRHSPGVNSDMIYSRFITVGSS